MLLWIPAVTADLFEMTNPQASDLYPLNSCKLPGGASPLAALLFPYTLPVCSVAAPWRPGSRSRHPRRVSRAGAPEPGTCSADMATVPS